jgi:hypothetical protein
MNRTFSSFVLIFQFMIGLNLFATADFHGVHHEAERSATRAYYSMANGKLADLKGLEKADWPFEILSIGHTMVSYQNYSSDPYFHHGLDIRGEAGQDVVTPVPGKVVNIENYVPGYSAYWEVAILDDNGFIWQYHHVDRGSIPEEIWQAYRSGGRVEAGTKLGEIYYWSVVTYGERYHHIHLNILGDNKEYLNPFLFLKDLDDNKGPEITAIDLVKNRRRVRSDRISGEYSLMVEASDLILHDKFLVPPYKVSYILNGGEEVLVWKFDNLPGNDSINKFVHDYYLANETCGNYRCRKHSIDLSFSTTSKRSFPTERGENIIRVIVEDFSGNRAQRDFSWTVE